MRRTAYDVEFTAHAAAQLEYLTTAERVRVLDSVERQLRYEPGTETRNRKLLRPNPLAPWELRVGALRVFYEIDVGLHVVWILAVGKKRHNVLRIAGREIDL